MRAELERLEEAIGHHFADRSLLARALTHSSHAHEHALAGTGEPLPDNEPLEFLGDSILGFLISEWLIRHFPDHREGRLSQIKAHLVSATHLYDVARQLDLGSYLQLSRGEEMSGGRTKRTLLGDAVEAVIAGIYLDGGMEAARGFVERFVLPHADNRGTLEEQAAAAVVDFRSALQELAQARKLPAPRYSIVSERGPEHSKTFTVEVRVGKDLSSQAEGFTKKSAAQKAAREVYERLAASH
jgi:ribonuclease-3